jgi:histone-lysine N-methyltransferase SETMAR
LSDKICKNFNNNNNHNNSCSNYDEPSCTCIRNGPFYTQDKKLIANFQDKNWHRQITYPIVECNIECVCEEDTCQNRVVQLGSEHDLLVFDCGLKGKGVKTNSFIQAGQFVADYLGEIIGLNEAERLIKLRKELNEPNYILFLKEHCSRKETRAAIDDNQSTATTTIITVIDAKNYSNIARFINHSCEPNLFVLPVRINNIVPHAALFALRDIQMGEELSYDYMPPTTTTTGEKSQDTSLSDVKCLCGSALCRKFLPAL